MKVCLKDIANVIRSKNAGPFELTLDVILKTEDMFEKMRAADIINKASIAALYRIPEDVDHDLPQFHFIAYIIIVDGAFYMALIINALVPALAADYGVHLFQSLGEGELLLLDGQPSGLDPAHVQDVVDDAEKMLGEV